VSSVQLVRQPVFDTRNAVVGYELRYRAAAAGGDPLIQSCLSGAVDDLRAGRPAWVYPDWASLTDDTFGFIDPSSLCLVLQPEHIACPAALERVSALAARGFTIVLGDAGEEDLSSIPQCEYVKHAGIVRLDLLRHNLPTLLGLADDFAARGKRVAVDGVVDTEAFDACREAGIHLMQGPHFAHPEPIADAELPASTATALRVMAMVRDANTPDRDIELALSADPAIVLQLLRIVNSAAIGGRGITSIGHALRMSGRANVARWLSLAAYATPKHATGLERELTQQAVQRAFFAEALARTSRKQDPSSAFLVGLFSLMDAVFRMPIADVIARVNLADEVRDALLDRTGPCADTLSLIEAYELGMWEPAAAAAAALGIDANTLGPMYNASIKMARELVAA